MVMKAKWLNLPEETDSVISLALRARTAAIALALFHSAPITGFQGPFTDTIGRLAYISRVRMTVLGGCR
jgi:hypothetical protein